MTRKSKRELQRELEELEAEQDRAVEWREVLEYLQHVAAAGADAQQPSEYFGGDVECGQWIEVAPTLTNRDLPPGIAPEDLSPIEAFGYRYCGDDVRRGILEHHLERERDQEREPEGGLKAR